MRFPWTSIERWWAIQQRVNNTLRRFYPVQAREPASAEALIGRRLALLAAYSFGGTWLTMKIAFRGILWPDGTLFLQLAAYGLLLAAALSVSRADSTER